MNLLDTDFQFEYLSFDKNQKNSITWIKVGQPSTNVPLLCLSLIRSPFLHNLAKQVLTTNLYRKEFHDTALYWSFLNFFKINYLAALRPIKSLVERYIHEPDANHFQCHWRLLTTL